MIIDVSDIQLSDIRFRVTRADGRLVDFSQFVTDYAWTDHVNVAGAEASISAQGSPELISQIGMEGSTAVVSAPLPDVLTGQVSRREMWRGFFEEVADEHSAEGGLQRQITAYDMGKMLATNDEDYVFRAATLSGMVRRVAQDFSIPLGTVIETSQVLGDIVGRGEALWDILQKGVQRHHDLTGETFRLYAANGFMHMMVQGSAERWWVFEVGRSLHNLRRVRTVADMENRVKIYGVVTEELSVPSIEASVENPQSQGIYGLRQRVEYLTEAEDRLKLTQLAQQRIDLRSIPDETIEITGWAVPLLRAGEPVRVIDAEMGVTGKFFVESVDCTWNSDGAQTIATARKEPIAPGLFMDQLVVA